MNIENHGKAPMYALRKDHKKHQDENKGPPTRPVCAGNRAYNNKLSHMISKIIKMVGEEKDSNCESTEEILAEIKAINEKEERKNSDEEEEEEIIIGSLDVVALYPSMDIEFTAERVSEAFIESEVEIRGINVKELGLYIMLNKTEEEIKEKDIAKFCPKRKTKKGKPTVSGHAMKNNDDDRYKQWEFPEETPNKQEEKKMMAEALNIVIKVIMKNHVYECNNETKKQKEGGPIGLELTGELAKVLMNWWDEQLKKKIKEQEDLKIAMYKRYIDDINLAIKTKKEREQAMSQSQTKVKRIMETTEDEEETATWRNDERETKKKELMREETTLKERRKERKNNGDETEMKLDEKVMRRIQAIGNEIHPSIQLTYDCPSKNKDGKLPILDVKMWTTEKDGKQTIIHEFYQKEISTKHVIHARSAMPTRQKRTILTQEAIRIMQRSKDEKETKKHLQEFSKRMQFSGYRQKFRSEVIHSAKAAFNKMKEEERKGERPIHRERNWKRKERKKIKRDKKNNWYKKGGYESVVFIPTTPKSELKRMYETIIQNSKVKIKVIERRGTILKNILQKSRPLGEIKCEKQDECMVCKHKSKGDCRKENVTYEISCSKCEKVYIGETSKNAFTRGKQHTRQLQTKDKQSVLYRHLEQDHKEERETPEFKMKILKSHRSALDRQVTEAIMIDRKERDKLMNNKTEWGHNKMTRMRMTCE